jgi:molybdopterin/thiamine biosynthesis adenylyltransferase
MGVGKFSIADPDQFELANVNRQFGAMCSTFGRNKAEVMAEIARDINPQVDVRIFTEPLGRENATKFLKDADVFVDAIEVFEMDVRRHLFHLAASQDIYAITAGPVGFSGVWLIFDPRGMSFDKYFDLSDEMDLVEKVAAFAIGVCPKATQRTYMNLRSIDMKAHRGPSSAAGCQIAAGAMSCEVVKILLGKRPVKAAPYFHQFDPYVGQFATGFLRWGNRHPWQRIKRTVLNKALQTPSH